MAECRLRSQSIGRHQGVPGGQLGDVQERHHHDLSSCQDTIQQLQNELRGTKWKPIVICESTRVSPMSRWLWILRSLRRGNLGDEGPRFSRFSGGVAGPLDAHRQLLSRCPVRSEGPGRGSQHRFAEGITEEARAEGEESGTEGALEAVAEAPAVSGKEKGEVGATQASRKSQGAWAERAGEAARGGEDR